MSLQSLGARLSRSSVSSMRYFPLKARVARTSACFACNRLDRPRCSQPPLGSYVRRYFANERSKSTPPLDEKLWPNLQGAPGFMPQDWPVQAVKLACLLRCSDAIQIDQRRAPAFAFAIHDPEGESALHWLAQQLAQPVVICDPGGGPGRLLFTSQTDFTEDRADAWWIAHDFVSIG
jgi:hypothetical protein